MTGSVSEEPPAAEPIASGAPAPPLAGAGATAAACGAFVAVYGASAACAAGCGASAAACGPVTCAAFTRGAFPACGAHATAAFGASAAAASALRLTWRPERTLSSIRAVTTACTSRWWERRSAATCARGGHAHVRQVARMWCVQIPGSSRGRAHKHRALLSSGFVTINTAYE